MLNRYVLNHCLVGQQQARYISNLFNFVQCLISGLILITTIDTALFACYVILGGEVSTFSVLTLVFYSSQITEI